MITILELILVVLLIFIERCNCNLNINHLKTAKAVRITISGVFIQISHTHQNCHRGFLTDGEHNPADWCGEGKGELSESLWEKGLNGGRAGNHLHLSVVTWSWHTLRSSLIYCQSQHRPLSFHLFILYQIIKTHHWTQFASLEITFCIEQINVHDSILFKVDLLKSMFKKIARALFNTAHVCISVMFKIICIKILYSKKKNNSK